MKDAMAEGRNSVGEPEKRPSLFTQTTEEEARIAVAAAAAVRPRPSIVVSARNQQNSNNFLRWKRQLQRALKWGTSHHDRNQRNLFNPEVLTRQKRQWSELQMQALERKQQKKDPTSFFEHFVVVGLHPTTNVQATEAAFARKKAWQRDVEKAERLGGDAVKYKGPPLPTLEPQVLFKYPLGKRLPLKSRDLPDFCFPSGVEARLMERTPSMSDLNEIMYGQSHQKRDDQSFVFLLKVADNATLYGVCVFVPEIVQRAPGFLAMNTALSPPQLPPSRFLVSAPRCYCLLTRLPFFHLHFEVLNSIIAQERLDRITECVNEMALTEQVPPMVKVGSKGNGKLGSPMVDDPNGWMESAIPVDSVLGATAAAAGLISESKMNSFASKGSGPLSPETAYGYTSPRTLSPLARTVEKEFVVEEADTTADQGLQVCNGFKGGMEVHPEEEVEKSVGHTNGNIKTPLTSVNVDRAEDVGSSSSMGTFAPRSSVGHERVDSSESLYSNSIFESSIRSNDSDEDDVEEASHSGQEDTFGSEAVLAWAKANNNDSLRIVCAYHSLPVPSRGESVAFQSLEHLSPLTFTRPSTIPPVLTGGGVLDLEKCRSNLELAEARAAAMAGEEAEALATWGAATVCRALSLENVLAMLAGALLEKQMLVVCPNLILPNKMLDFLDAPVPFIVGVQHKTSEVRAKSSNLVRVNVYKDKVTVSSMPQLPRHKELMSALEPYHSKLAAEKGSAKRHPVHQCSESQVRAAEGFLAVLSSYLESLCNNLRSHTITNVQSNDDKVSLLLKDSFIDSFPIRDQPFIKLFADTQLFAVYTDAVLSSYQNS